MDTGHGVIHMHNFPGDFEASGYTGVCVCEAVFHRLYILTRE